MRNEDISYTCCNAEGAWDSAIAVASEDMRRFGDDKFLDSFVGALASKLFPGRGFDAVKRLTNAQYKGRRKRERN